MCPKLIELLSWNGPTVRVCYFMLARAHPLKHSLAESKKRRKNLRQPKNSLAVSLVSRGTTVFYFCSVCTIVNDPLPFSTSWKTHTQHSSNRRQEEQKKKSVEFVLPVHQVFLVLIASSLDYPHKKKSHRARSGLRGAHSVYPRRPVSKMADKAVKKRKRRMWRWFILHEVQFFMVLPKRRMGNTKLPSFPFWRCGHLILRIYFRRSIYVVGYFCYGSCQLRVQVDL